ncbi:MAG: family 20 glycosylhydrolase [Candidatus Marinimicrobia bacterium]|nr:family 20 glycosylhydrolase [Candidatus Neomarinimicrobiota bacterium]
MKKFLLLSLTLILIFSCSTMNLKIEKSNAISIVPEPVSIEKTGGVFQSASKELFLKKSEDITLDPIENYFINLFSSQSGIKFTDDETANQIQFAINELPDPELGIEGYKIIISSRHLEARANTTAGLFYSLQTMRQLFPVDAKSPVSIPCGVITDTPRFSWRGTMLDVSRHFFPKEDILKLIDVLALHKINTFHWHLVDDQGWRIEIKQYSKLTEVGAWRVDREEQHWNSREKQKPGEKASYGGFYTQEEVKEIINYAAERFITIVPEIELPAHVTSALAAYPQYSCTGGPFTVLPGGVWPITDIYCAGNDETFQFLENILSEVIDLFPGPYIHIGGDEATKTEWEKCPKCQARIQQEGLKNEHELQSYFVRRIEKFIVSKGRKMIGWDEILEGGLAPEATVMSWRGFEGGIEAAKSGHDVVMTPTSHCYFDYYQGDPENEPLAIGGYVPLKKVYEFEPVPEELNTQEARHILGGQCNLWTEYMSNFNHVQYMLLPRLAAMSEVLWSSPQKRDLRHFSAKMKNLLALYDKLGLNYARSAFQVFLDADFDVEEKKFHVELRSEIEVPEIRYTLNGENPTTGSLLYQKPLTLKKSTEIKAAAFSNGQAISPVTSKKCLIHKATGMKYILTTPPSKKYTGNSDIALTNSLLGTANHSDGNWSGFEGNDLEATIEFNSSKSISGVSVGFLHNAGAWIFSPEYLLIEGSGDGQNFTELKKKVNVIDQKSGDREVVRLDAKFDEIFVKYLRIKAKNIGTCPEWHAGAGGKAWLFVDEIIVE